MATINIEKDGGGKQSIVDDFMYGSNVAQSHISIRMGFLRKVYGILTAQLVFTTFIGALFMTVDQVKAYVRGNDWMLMLAFISSIALIFALMWKRRESPANYILLAMFTFVEAYTIGVVVTFYNVQVVLEAFSLTCAVTVGLTMYTMQSKKDFSAMGASLFSVLWILIMAGFLQVFMQSPLMDRAISIAGAIIFCLFIVYDTHMIMHRLSAEEYIMAAIDLYLDILNLFLYILRILNESRRG